jgi:SulP family sulfate permease
MRPELVNSLKGYSLKLLFSDLSAGFIAGVVALPLSIAFAIASGVSPERGLFTSIIAGLIIAALGGSRVQIGGPTGAFVVIISGIMQNYGYDALMVATIMAGVMILLLGVFKLGVLIKFIPYTIVTGFTAGVAVVIFTSQIGDFFGLKAGTLPGDFVGKISAYVSAVATANPWACGVAVLCLVILSLWPLVNKKIPGAIVVIILATIAVQFFSIPVDTIGSRYGSIPTSLPAPRFPSFSLELIRPMFQPAVSIAVLASIESLMTAVVADGMIGRKHDSNMELVAQGVANVASPIFGGIPAVGALARTATNIRNGARTPIAGITHSVTLLLILLFLGRFVVYIPMPALAAILFSVAWNMAGFPAVKALCKGQKSDIAVFAATFLLTVFIDITVAIEVGLALSAFFFIRKMIDVSTIKEFQNEVAEAASAPKADPNSFSLRSIPKRVLVFEIEGPLFFGTVQKFEQMVLAPGVESKVLVLRMRNTMYLDAGGIHVIEDLHRDCRKRGITLLLSDIHTQPFMLAVKTGLDRKLGTENIFGNLDEALARAAEIVGVPYTKETHEPTVEREKNGKPKEGISGQ